MRAAWVRAKEKVTQAIDEAKLTTQNAFEKHDKYKSLLELVVSYNYPIEKYFYETKDGHINCVYRISGPKYTKAWENEQLKNKRPVVIYQHGLLDAGAGICCDGVNSLAFLLADHGFDVWLNNSRGNRFSRHHVYLDPDVDKEFWNFSFQEMAEFDQPALFEFVLSKTNVENVTYIGHSQGTMQMFAALIENLDFFKTKINLAIMLAPVTRVDRMTCGTVHKLKDSQKLFELLEGQGPEIMANPQVESKMMGGFLWATGLANFSLGMISDEDTSLLSKHGKETYFGHYPSGTSLRCLDHFKQLINTGKFLKYDFGADENIKRYGVAVPPEYDLTRIKDVPIALFCGLKDRLASAGDYRWLKEQLSVNNTVKYYREFNLGHCGFLIPPSYEHLYEIVNLAKQYSQSCGEPQKQQPLSE